MRTSNSAQLAYFIVKESFGESVADVVQFLIRKTKSPLRVVCSETKLALKQVKLCLTVGIQHNFIVVSKHRRGFYEYSVDTNAILQRLRYPSFVYCTKLLYGNIAEVLVEEILHHGRILHSNLIPRAVVKLARNVKEKVSEGDVTTKLQTLMSTNFIELCLDPDGVEEEETTSHSPPRKRIKTDSSQVGACYKICTARFNYYNRDLQMVAAVARKLGHTQGKILSTMLRLSEVRTDPSAYVSAPISANEIFNALPKELLVTSRITLNTYMMTLSDDEMKIVVKVGDDGGGSYVIDYMQAMTLLCTSSMEALVLERFGSRSLRLFKILLAKQHLEQKQLEEMAMIPPRDTKQLLYNMYSHRFVSVSEVAKTADHAPSRTFYCFNVPVEQLARQLLEYNYKSILNLMSKRLQILSDNKRLLDKQQKMEAIIATLGQDEEEQRAEIEAMITPAEQQQLQTVKLQTNRLENGELQLTETTLTWDMFLDYRTLKRFDSLPRARGSAR